MIDHDHPTEELASRRAIKDHAIAAEVWNRLGIDNVVALGHWLQNVTQEIHYHRSRMTLEELADLDAKIAGFTDGQ